MDLNSLTAIANDPSVKNAAGGLFGDPNAMIAGIVFGIIGMGYWAMGKDNMPYKIAGGILMFAPMFIDTAMWITIICGATMAATYLFTRNA